MHERNIYDVLFQVNGKKDSSTISLMKDRRGHHSTEKCRDEHPLESRAIDHDLICDIWANVLVWPFDCILTTLRSIPTSI